MTTTTRTTPPAAKGRSLKRRCIAIINPQSGGGRSLRQWHKLAPAFRNTLENYEVEEKFTTGPRHAEQLARAAALQGAEVVLAVGGDGTIHEVVNGLMTAVAIQPRPESGTALAVLPCGTGSDFARTFGWTDCPVEAASRIQRDQRHPLDVGLVTCSSPSEGEVKRYFVNMMDCGLGGLVAGQIDRFKMLGARLGYTCATVASLLRYRNAHCRIVLDNDTVIDTTQLTTAAVANGKFFGGGMKFAPDADTSDGLFEVILMSGKGLLDFALLESRLRNGSHLSVPGVQRYTAKVVEFIPDAALDGSVTDSAQKLWFELDGEVLGYAPGKVEMLPSALPLLC